MKNCRIQNNRKSPLTPPSGLTNWKLLLIAMAGLNIGLVQAAEIWSDDVESYQVGSLEYGTPWILSGNTAASVTTAQSKSGSKSIQLYGEVAGCWGTHAHRYVGTNQSMRITFNVMVGGETLTGCHPEYVTVQMGSAATWASDTKGLLSFNKDGTIHAGGSLQLGAFESNTWYKVSVLFDRYSTTNCALHYWINDELKASTNYSAPASELNLGFLSIGADEGTSWFDDIQVEDAGSTTAMIATATEIGWTSIPGKTYQVQWTLDVDSANWVDLGTPVLGTGGTNSVFDSTRGVNKRFYRVQVLQ